MKNNANITKLLQTLRRHDVYSSKDLEKDLQKLVTADIKKFAQNFYRDFSRKDFDNYNKYEKLRLNKSQKKKIDGNDLWRYEYRNTSNLRCIFIIYRDNNIDKTFILCAFNENGDKKSGKDSYKQNISRAIDIYERIMVK